VRSASSRISYALTERAWCKERSAFRPLPVDIVRCGEVCKRGSDFLRNADREELRVGAKVRVGIALAPALRGLAQNYRENRLRRRLCWPTPPLRSEHFPPNVKSFQRREIGYYVGAIFWIR